MGKYSIKDLESLSGVKAHTIRIWEQRYQLLHPSRTPTNIRYYTDEDLKTLLNVSLLNKHGIKISNIAHMDKNEMGEKVLSVTSASSDEDILTESLLRSMLDFDEERFEKALNTAIMREGFEKAFVHVLLPLMQRTGVLWVSGSVKPSQEHFISNLIRRKLCVAVDNIFHDKEKPSKKFLLFLPEGETHELLLLFTEYILRKNNHQVAYIGSSLPSDDIPFVHRKFKPDVLLTYITVPLKSVTVQQFIDGLSETFPAIKIIVGGFQVSNESIKFPGNVEHIHSMEDLMRVM